MEHIQRQPVQVSQAAQIARSSRNWRPSDPTLLLRWASQIFAEHRLIFCHRQATENRVRANHTQGQLAAMRHVLRQMRQRRFRDTIRTGAMQLPKHAITI